MLTIAYESPVCGNPTAVERLVFIVLVKSPDVGAFVRFVAVVTAVIVFIVLVGDAMLKNCLNAAAMYPTVPSVNAVVMNPVKYALTVAVTDPTEPDKLPVMFPVIATDHDEIDANPFEARMNPVFGIPERLAPSAPRFVVK
mgnify:CR=1 FL=1